MNIILVVFDTLRKDCAGIYGSPPWGKMHVPHFEAFAKESLVMTNAYPESLPTLPARRALYTGQRVYPFSDYGSGYKGDNISMPGWGPIREDQHTVSEILKEAGWRTALISDVFHMFKPSKNFWRGFDQWTFIRGQEMDLYRSGPDPSPEELAKAIGPHIPGGMAPVRAARQMTLNMMDKTKEEDYFAAQVMRQAGLWVEQNQDAEKFFLVVESFSPHEYWFAPEHYRAMYLKEPGRAEAMTWDDPAELMRGLANRTLSHYAGLVSLCDRWFGHFMETLRVTGRLDDTMVIFTADHGHSIGDPGFIGKKGYPSRPEVFDVPLMIRFPKAEHAGAASNLIVQHHDISAAILDAAGAAPPQPLDGLPFVADALAGKSGARRHATIGWAEGMTVVKDHWWFNCKVDGRGAVLYDRRAGFGENVVEKHIALACELFELGKQDAGGGPFADHLLERARKTPNAPGSVDLA